MDIYICKVNSIEEVKTDDKFLIEMGYETFFKSKVIFYNKLTKHKIEKTKCNRTLQGLAEDFRDCGYTGELPPVKYLND